MGWKSFSRPHIKDQLIFIGMKQEKKNHYRVRSVTPTNFLSFDSFDMESKVKSVFPGSKSLWCFFSFYVVKYVEEKKTILNTLSITWWLYFSLKIQENSSIIIGLSFYFSLCSLERLSAHSSADKKWYTIKGKKNVHKIIFDPV